MNLVRLRFAIQITNCKSPTRSEGGGVLGSDRLHVAPPPPVTALARLFVWPMCTSLRFVSCNDIWYLCISRQVDLKGSALRFGCEGSKLQIARFSRAAKRGGFKRGGFPDLDLSFLFCPFWHFPDFSGIFPICSGMVQGFS